MKVFWAIIGVLLLGAVSALLLSDRGVTPPKALPTGGPATTTLTPNEPLPEPGARNPGKDTRVLVEPEPAPASKPEAKPEAGGEPKAEAMPAESKPAEPKPAGVEPGAPPAPAPAEVKPAESSVLENKPIDPAADRQEHPLEAPEAAPIPAVKIEKKDDGSMVLDGRFTVKGAGTADNPYVLPWELLTSAEEVYKPQQGRKELPGRITMFDGKFVRIAGYVAYPMFVEQPRELLSMLNQWDGCCIGIPPTPYDAIEVKLADVVKGNDRLATYGTVEGKLGVKPYLAGDWLVGLYIMEDAKLSVKEYKVGS